MKIATTYPPNIEAIKTAFGPLRPSLVFTYGDTLYNPNNLTLADNLITHEYTHSVQQGKDPAGWWDKYIKDPVFRLKMEVQAYRNQYKVFRSHKENRDRQKSYFFGYKLATDLAGPIYGNIIDLKTALQRITIGL